MSTATLSREEWNSLQRKAEQSPKKVVEKIKYITKSIPTHAVSFLDSLSFLIIGAIYFTFTGIAILLNRKLPKFWIDLAKTIGGEKIAKKIEVKEKVQEMEKKAAKVRIVDLETGTNLKLPRP